MEWTDLARRLVTMGAPTLGAALGGPLGGVAGKILADALGAAAPTPAAVEEKLPQCDAATLCSAEERWLETLRAEAEAARVSVTEVNTTMRAELTGGTALQRNWRPLTGYVFAGLVALIGLAVSFSLFAAVITGRVEVLNAVIGALGGLTGFLAVPGGVVGLYVSGRSREKQAAITGEAAPGALTRIGEALRRTPPPAAARRG